MPKVISDNCVGCGVCADVCPISCIEAGEPFVVDADVCIDCGACEAECPTGTIE